MRRWAKAYFEGYHKGRLGTHAKEELLEHNELIQRLIPANQLLVYELGEGWDRLAEFLGVPVPEEPFPHLNESAAFLEEVRDPAEQSS
ncbi:hypothetical protein M422DRAFT_266571 [Sphaerobolus stellatus SS14]|uniref:Protein-tyrosine sulfotransferase n=1 Tax=Sphaerobolus stellatus (strain SS14) TaxID=990650 RepID=A0A0C9V298_SPHS4|nr:hypothetical protein M422DRAFT_266571 [Sphaerobolus stellatus SS14]